MTTVLNEQTIQNIGSILIESRAVSSSSSTPSTPPQYFVTVTNINENSFEREASLDTIAAIIATVRGLENGDKLVYSDCSQQTFTNPTNTDTADAVNVFFNGTFLGHTGPAAIVAPAAKSTWRKVGECAFVAIGCFVAALLLLSPLAAVGFYVLASPVATTSVILSLSIAYGVFGWVWTIEEQKKQIQN